MIALTARPKTPKRAVIAAPTAKAKPKKRT